MMVLQVMLKLTPYLQKQALLTLVLEIYILNHYTGAINADVSSGRLLRSNG